MGSVSSTRKEEDDVGRIHGFNAVGSRMEEMISKVWSLWGLRIEGNKTKEIMVMQTKEDSTGSRSVCTAQWAVSGSHKNVWVTFSPPSN